MERRATMQPSGSHADSSSSANRSAQKLSEASMQRGFTQKNGPRAMPFPITYPSKEPVKKAKKTKKGKSSASQSKVSGNNAGESLEPRKFASQRSGSPDSGRPQSSSRSAERQKKPPLTKEEEEELRRLEREAAKQKEAEKAEARQEDERSAKKMGEAISDFEKSLAQSRSSFNPRASGSTAFK